MTRIGVIGQNNNVQTSNTTKKSSSRVGIIPIQSQTRQPVEVPENKQTFLQKLGFNKYFGSSLKPAVKTVGNKILDFGKNLAETKFVTGVKENLNPTTIANVILSKSKNKSYSDYANEQLAKQKSTITAPEMLKSTAQTMLDIGTYKIGTGLVSGAGKTTVGGIVKGMVSKKALPSAAIGAGYGATELIGEKNITPKKVATNIATGAATGVVAQGAVEGLGLLGNKIVNKINQSIASKNANKTIKTYSAGTKGATDFSTTDKSFASTFKDSPKSKMNEVEIKPSEYLDTRIPEQRAQLESVLGKETVDKMVSRTDNGLPNHYEAGEQDALKQAAYDLGYKGIQLSETTTAGKFNGKDVISFAKSSPKVSGSVVPTQYDGNADNLVTDFVSRLGTTKELRAETNKLYKIARSQKFAEFKDKLAKATTLEEMNAAKASLAGALPKATGKEIASELGTDRVNALANMINKTNILDTMEKTSALDGLQKILNGMPAQPKQIVLLEEIFGKEFAEKMVERSKFDKAIEIIGIPKSLLSTADISATLRQGMKLGARHPLVWVKNAGKELKQLVNKDYFEKTMLDIKNNPNYAAARKFDIGLTGLNKAKGVLNKEENYIASDMVDRIPIWGKVMAASDRAFTGFMNNMRMDTWNIGIRNLEKLGITPQSNPKEYQDLANLIRVAGGRGDLKVLGKSFEGAGSAASTVLFAPKYWASNIQYINPNWYMRLAPQARKEYMKQATSYMALGAGILTMAKASGAEVEVNPLSNNFGKFKKPGTNTWIDVWPTGRKEISLLAQLFTGSRKTSSGDTKKLKDIYPGESRLSLTSKYVQGKLSPTASTAVNLYRGSNIVGEKNTPESVFKGLTTPIYISDIDSIKEEGGSDSANIIAVTSLLAALGIGVSTTKPEMTASDINKEYQKTLVDKGINMQTISNWWTGRDRGELATELRKVGTEQYDLTEVVKKKGETKESLDKRKNQKLDDILKKLK